MERAKVFLPQYLKVYWPSPKWINWAGSCANALLMRGRKPTNGAHFCFKFR